MLRDNPISRFIPALKQVGVDFLVAAAELGIGIQVCRSFALAGASPHTISFASLQSQAKGEALKAPLDTDYLPIIIGNSAARVDLATRTRTSFQVTGGSAADVVAFVIIGRFGSMKR